jgi:hypothetical protein
VQGRIAFGPRAGQGVVRRGDFVDGDVTGAVQRRRCAEHDGFSLHADVAVAAHDRQRLERLCRYVARAPPCAERLSELPDGRLLHALNRPWRDGTSAFVFEPLELVEELVALIPPPRANLVRYHGVLAPRARWRAQVVRDRRSDVPPPAVAVARPARPRQPRREPRSPPRMRLADPLRQRHLTWAELMKRVWAVDVLTCVRCAGPMELVATITQPEVIPAILRCLGLPPRAPPLAPAREPPQRELWPG